MKKQKKPILSPQTIERICTSLEREYRNPRHGNKTNPLDELIYIVLSTRTQEKAFRSIYANLRSRFKSWANLQPNHHSIIEKILRPGGLSRLKTKQIVGILSRIRLYAHKTTLSFLNKFSTEEAEKFLTSLPGVSKKVAKCVLMYSLDRPVLPVDVHVHRVSKRIGLRVKNRPDSSQDLIEDLIPPKFRYGYHVNAVAHGRKICIPQKPKCLECCISRFCNYFQMGLSYV